MNWFESCKTVASVKALWRELAKKHHPDIGGDTATMQGINAAYHEALKRLDGVEEHDETGKAHRYHYEQAREQEIMDKINSLLKEQMSGIEIHLIGLWIWITGDTKPNKETLKKHGCLWHSKRLCWYWRQKALAFHRRNAPKHDLATLAGKYGCRTFDQWQEKAVAVA